jgi:hypothetical protein
MRTWPNQVIAGSLVLLGFLWFSPEAAIAGAPKLAVPEQNTVNTFVVEISSMGVINSNWSPPELAAPLVGVATPNMVGGQGAFEVGSDGGVFAFGDAPFLGSLPELGVRPAGSIVGIAAVPGGGGYWLVGSDGGVFAFGDAPFLGGENGMRTPSAVALIAGAGGYVIVDKDESVHGFGSFLPTFCPGAYSSPPAAVAASAEELTGNVVCAV